MGKTYAGNTSDESAIPKKIYVGNDSNLSVPCKVAYCGDSNGKSVEVWRNSTLPSIYQKVEYILNSNTTEYINTEVKPNSDTTIYLEYELVNDTQSGFFGAIPGTDNFHVYGANITSNNPRKMYGAFNTSMGEFLIGNVSLNTRYRLDFNKPGGYFYLNNSLIYSSTNTFANTGNKGIVLYGVYSYSQIEIATVKMRVYRFQAWQNGVMIRDMYPCYLKSDSQTVGMYDLIGGQFYGNSGTGIFYKGPDIN